MLFHNPLSRFQRLDAPLDASATAASSTLSDQIAMNEFGRGRWYKDRSACVEMRVIRNDSERLNGGDESDSRRCYSRASKVLAAKIASAKVTFTNLQR
jgi:hypothetical protein